MSQAATGIIWTTDWIGAQLHISSRWASRAGFLVLWGIGMTFIQVDEYSLALASWLLSAIVLGAKSIHWAGVPGRLWVTRCVRVAYFSGALFFVVLSIIWTVTKKGDKPWSNISIAWNRYASDPPRLTTPTRPPRVANASEIARETSKELDKAGKSIGRQAVSPNNARVAINSKVTSLSDEELAHRISMLSTLADGVWFRLTLDVPDAFLDKFKASNQSLIDSLKADPASPERSTAIWQSMIGLLLPCDQQVGFQSWLSYVVSEQPGVFLTLENKPLGGRCEADTILTGRSVLGPRQTLSLRSRQLNPAYNLPFHNFNIKSLNIQLPINQSTFSAIGEGPIFWRSVIVKGPTRLYLQSEPCVNMRNNAGCLEEWARRKPALIAETDSYLPTLVTVQTDVFNGPTATTTYHLDKSMNAKQSAIGPMWYQWVRNDYKEEGWDK